MKNCRRCISIWSFGKKLLHLEDLHLYDVYVPLVERPEKEIPFEEAKKIVKEGLSVLGEDYVRLLEEGFDNGWIDVYENQGKRAARIPGALTEPIRMSC